MFVCSFLRSFVYFLLHFVQFRFIIYICLYMIIYKYNLNIDYIGVLCVCGVFCVCLCQATRIKQVLT